MARVAIIVDDMFEDSEFKEPYDRLKAAGHEALVVGLEAGKQLKGKRGKVRTKAEVSASDVSADELDALVIPGGYSPDHLRTDERMVALTREMVSSGKPVAVVCHGPWMLAEADVARGRTLTSWPSIRTDLVNAGARWVDQEVVEDGNLITSRKPADLPAFCEALLRQLERRAPARASRGETERPPTVH
jgi:protease I